MSVKSATARSMLYEAVVRNDFEPGSFLDEQELARRFGLGRTPVREAVKRLAAEGLLEILPRKGILVKPLTPAFLQDILETRSFLEPDVAGLAAQRITPEQVNHMWQLHAKFEPILQKDDAWELSCLDRSLHQAVAQAAGNSVMFDVLERLSTHMQRVWIYTYRLEPHWEKRLLMAPQWEALIRHIAEGEVEAAQAAMHLHVTYGQQDLHGTKNNS